MAKKTAARERRSKSGFFGSLWKGLVILWQHPLIITLVLLGLAGYLFREVITQTFASVMNCDYLLVTKLAWPAVVCDGFTLELPGWVKDPLVSFLGKGALDGLPFKLPGLSAVIDTPLEILRKILVWGAVVLSALLSFFLTMMASKLRSVIRLILLNREEWRNFLFGLRTWAFFFLLICGAFYYWANIYLMQPR